MSETAAAKKSPRKANRRPALHQASPRRVRLRDREGSRVPGRFQDQQCQAAPRDVIIAIALFAQFYNKKFPENRDFLIGCIVLYIFFNVLLQLLTYTKEKNAILFTYPPAVSFNSTGLVVSSKLPRFSDLYTLNHIKCRSRICRCKQAVEFTKSVTQWFTKEGVLVEALFRKDVEALVDEYNKEPKKTK
ncbi:hypothetical protein MLD38_008705 [Melastoma candidum]|uniref:Uncharacterized protein n=1 Tax=Melastoma candidum TaxID=119954 RepID=A0ACB9RVR6_9MYRT|nr:hypothetical protein MLD38_008705 [Melastoma candidum]